MTMTTRVHRRVLVIATSLGFLGFGVLCGILLDEIRFERRRDAVLRPYQEALQQRNRELMKLELHSGGRHPAFAVQWRRSLARIGDALEIGDTAEAVAAWQEAYKQAVKSGWWEAMLDVGDAALEIGDVPEFRPSPQAAARQSYLTALLRARAQGSLDGVLRAGEAFAGLGDRAVVEQCLHIAHELTDNDPQGRSRVLGFAKQFLSVDRAAAEGRF